MTVVINGTSGITDVNGTAAAPAITGTDTDTGVFFGTNTVSLSTGGTERLQIDSSGNAGLGVTPSAWKSTSKALQVNTTGGFSSDTTYGTSFSDNVYLNSGTQWIRLTGNGTTTGLSTVYGQVNGAHYWYNAPVGSAGTTATLTQAMTLDASGKLLVGWTTAPTASASVIANGIQCTNTSGGGGYLMLGTSGGGQQFYTHTGVSGSESYTERMRIDSSGNLLVGATGVGGKLYVVSGLTSNNGCRVDTPASFTSNAFVSICSTVGSTSWTHFAGYGNAGSQTNILIYGNGNIQNANNSYGAISDAKLKENVTDATPKLEKLNQIRVVNYNLIGSEQKQIGVIAQELEQIFPGMVEEAPDYENVTTTDEDGNETTERVATGTTTKSVKYSVFVPMLIKAMQEQQAIIEQLQADVAALKGQA